MKRKITLVLSLLIVGFTSYSQEKANNQTTNKTLSKKELKKLKELHAYHLENNPYKETFLMSKSKRKDLGLPPNKYFEQRYLLTMDPATGKLLTENLEIIRKQLQDERALALASGRTPGDAADNAWVERGPNNVGGRTKAMIFDPNDATFNTVIAGGVSGGLWKNTNISSSASTWTRVNIPDNLNVSSLSVDPNNNQIFYAGTGESYSGGDTPGNGVWKSTDGGATWNKVFGGVTGATYFQSASNLTVNTPSGIAGNYTCTTTTAFGPGLTSAITANIVLVNDGTGTTSDGCEALTNGASVSGKIALIRRGTCSFVQKISNAQATGAIAVIMMNNVSGSPISMGGTSDLITIPSIMVSKETGDMLETALGTGSVNVTLNPPTPGMVTGNVVPGSQYINDVVTKNNGGTTEIYVAASDMYDRGAYLGSDSYGLYKSTNGGATWTQLNLPLTSNGNKYCPMDIEIGPNGNIWVSTTSSTSFNDGGGKVFMSNDGGATFQDKFTVTGNGGGDRVEIEVSATNPNKVYVLSQLKQNDANNPTIEVAIFKTTDGFTTTSSVSLPNSAEGGRTATYGFTGQQAFYDLMIEADPSNDDIVYVGGIDMFRTSNGGTSWSQITSWNSAASCSPMHSDVHGMTFKPGTPNTAVIGCDGGVYFSSNLSGAATSTSAITARNNGFNVTQFVGAATAPTNAVSGLTGDYFIAGAQDNGSQYFGPAAAGINGSVRVQGGDGGQCTFDQGADKYYTTSYVYNDNINSRTTTGTTKNLSSESLSRGLFYPTMALDSNLDILYTDYTDGSTPQYAIRRYANAKPGGAAAAKTTLTNALLTSYATSICVSKYTTASSKLFVGTANSKLLRISTANGTPAWYEFPSTPFVGSISDVELGANENQIFVTVGNYNTTSVWYTPNGGTNWYNIEGNLPDIPVNAILQNSLKSDEIIVATELGVWYANGFDPNATANQSLVWRQSYNGMSNARVTDLDLRNDGVVLAATYGRGIFTGSFTNTVLAAENHFIGKEVKIYPTVTNGEITISSSNNFGKTKIELFDLSGRQVYNNNIELNSNNEINLGKHSTGNYILKLTNDSFTESTKLIIK